MQEQSTHPAKPLAQTQRTLPMALLKAREAVMERYRPFLRRHGVTEQQWRVLRVLNEVDAIDASELAKAATILAPSLSRILRTLEARGLIILQKDRSDGRRILASLSSAGQSLLTEATPESAAITAEIETVIGHDRLEKLLDEIDTLLQALVDSD